MNASITTNNTTKSYAPVCYRNQKEAPVITMEATKKISPPAYVRKDVTTMDGGSSGSGVKPSFVKARALALDPMISKVKRRTNLFEEMAKQPTTNNKGPITKKSWVKNSMGGTNYEPKILHFSNLPPKKTLAELP